MKLKSVLISVFLIFSLLSGFCLAQNKVAVVPLMPDCGAVPTLTSAGGRVWMDRNLGAYRVAERVDDYQAYGWLYQWGRLADGHEVRSSTTTATLSSGDVPGHGDFITTSSSPYDWRNEQNDNLWQGASGINNPCPTGFRIPTLSEWETEMNSWSSQNAAGAFASPLKLVAAGQRRNSGDGFDGIDINGFYWSSTVIGTSAYYLGFTLGDAATYNTLRARGYSVRCIKD